MYNLMNKPSMVKNSQFRICRWCEEFHVYEDSFCSEQCRSKFFNWLETEHAAMRGKRPTYWNMIRQNALDRGGNRCHICNDDKDLSVHHIIPLSEGGDSTAQNLRVLCHKCHCRIHGRKGHKTDKKRKVRFRIRYQPLSIPGVLAFKWLCDEM